MDLVLQAASGKKIPRQILRTFNISEHIEIFRTTNSFSLTSRLLTGLIQIYLSQFRLLFEDYSAAIAIKKKIRAIRSIPLRPIRLPDPKNVEEKQSEIKDESFNNQTVIESENQDEMAMSIMSGDLPSIEIGRDFSAEIADVNLENPSESEKIKKIRKRENQEEGPIEFTEEEFRKIQSWIPKIKKIKITDENTIFSEFKNFLLQANAVEVMRGESTVLTSHGMSEQFSVPEIEIEPNFNESLIRETGILPSGEYEFCDFAKELSKIEKAKMFMSLLVQSGKGNAVVEQKTNFGKIFCTVL